MADDVRSLERRLARDPTDQDVLARVLAARRRTGLAVPLRLLEARLLPARTFTSSHRLVVSAVLPDGRVAPLGWTNVAGAGASLPIPAHRLLIVEPLDAAARLRPLVRALADEPALGLRLEARGAERGRADVPARALAELPGLERLEVRGLRLRPHGARALAGCPRLATLGLLGDAAPAAVEELARLPALVDLRLRGVPLEDPGALAGAPHLERLEVGRAPFGVAAVRALARAPALRALRLREVEGFDEEAQAALAAWQGLERLRLEPCEVNDGLAARVAALGRLVALELDHEGGRTLTRAGARALVDGLPGLTRLALDGAYELRDEVLLTLARGLPRLEQLEVGSGAWLTSGGLAGLPGLERLRRLRLARSRRVGAPGLAHVAAAPALEALELSGVVLGHEGCAALARASRLAQLDLGSTRVGPKGLALLARAGAPLRELLLGPTDDALLAVAAAFPGLRALGLERGPGLTPAGLAPLAALPDLEDLSVGLGPGTPERAALQALADGRPGLRLHLDPAVGAPGLRLFAPEA